MQPTEGKPITKKEACAVLNISYNTTRLDKILGDYQERKEYTAKRKAANRGKPATEAEIKEAVKGLLEGESISEIARVMYRSPTFVKNLLERIGVPMKPSGEHAPTELVPENCVSQDFEPGEVVWSAKYHKMAEIVKELNPSNLLKKKGMAEYDYERGYSSKCYSIYVFESVDSEDTFFPHVAKGGFNAYVPAYDLAKLTHLEEYGINLRSLQK